MAEKSTTKATQAKKTDVEMSLQDQLFMKRSDLMQAQKSHASGEMVNPRVLQALRKDIARILTKINAQKEAK
jgi:ribosomal protein L29